jgi:hypothetical protein
MLLIHSPPDFITSLLQGGEEQEGQHTQTLSAVLAGWERTTKHLQIWGSEHVVLAFAPKGHPDSKMRPKIKPAPAVCDAHEAQGVDGGDVPSVEPTAAGGGGPVLAVVALHDNGAPHLARFWHQSKQWRRC